MIAASLPHRKDPDNPKQWVVDEEAAVTVEQIFALCVEGYGPSQIARILEADKVFAPSAHLQSLGNPTPAKPPENPYRWAAATVSGVLEKKEYLGHTVNFKTFKQSYKSQKKLYNPEDKQKVFEDTHEAIIDPDTWERVQKLRKTKRRPAVQAKAICFLVSSRAPIAEKNCNTAQAGTLKRGKTILLVPLQG